MKTYNKFFINTLFLFICFIFGISNVEASELQTIVDNAKAGEVITLQEGIYEGPILIDKPITLRGNGKVIITSSSDETIAIHTNQVLLTNLQIQHESTNLSSTAIFIQGDRNQITNVEIITKARGITLDEASHNFISEIAIIGPYQTMDYNASMDSREGNAIDLFRSNDNQLTNISIEYAQDGIYLESSERNIITHCHVQKSRYGFHLMFTKDTKLTHNQSTENITGMMVMGTSGTQIFHNRLAKMKEHVHAQGMMLYDVHNANIEHNYIEQNLIGLLVENCSSNTIKNNVLIANYIGIQFSRSSENEFVQNDLLANVIHAYGDSSNENSFNENYWEGHQMIDITGDGKNDWSFYADPIFPVLVMKKPAYQIFADSPGLIFLNYLLDLDRTKLLQDNNASSIPNEYVGMKMDQDKWLLTIVYGGFSAILIYFMYLGGRKK